MSEKEELLQAIKEQIEESIKTVVNGKIDNLSNVMIQHMAEDTITANKLNEYIIADNKWKEEAKSAIDLGKNVSGFGKVFVYLLGIIGAISAIFFGAVAIIKKLV